MLRYRNLLRACARYSAATAPPAPPLPLPTTFTTATFATADATTAPTLPPAPPYLRQFTHCLVRLITGCRVYLVGYATQRCAVVFCSVHYLDVRTTFPPLHTFYTCLLRRVVREQQLFALPHHIFLPPPAPSTPLFTARTGRTFLANAVWMTVWTVLPTPCLLHPTACARRRAGLDAALANTGAYSGCRHYIFLPHAAAPLPAGCARVYRLLPFHRAHAHRAPHPTAAAARLPRVLWLHGYPAYLTTARRGALRFPHTLLVATPLPVTYLPYPAFYLFSTPSTLPTRAALLCLHRFCWRAPVVAGLQFVP